MGDWNLDTPVKFAALSPDGEVIATTCEEFSETAFLYSTKTGVKLAEVSIDSSRHIDESVLDYSPDGTLFLAGRDLYSVPSLEKLPIPPTLATRCQIGEFTEFYGPDGFSGDGRAVVYSNLSGGNLCLVNVSDGSIKWCWHHGRLVKAGPRAEVPAAGGEAPFRAAAAAAAAAAAEEAAPAAAAAVPTAPAVQAVERAARHWQRRSLSSAWNSWTSFVAS